MKKGRWIRKMPFYILLVFLAIRLLGNSRIDTNFRHVVYKVDDKNLVIITGEKNEDKIKQLVFPVDILIESTDQRGAWRLTKLIELKPKYGDDWLKDTISEQFANGISYDYDELSVRDKFYLWYGRLSKSVDLVEAETVGYLDEKIAPDGERFKILNEKWSKSKANIYRDSGLESEENYIWVENASEISGLGILAAESIDNAGAHVFDVSKTEEIIDKCRIVVDPVYEKTLTVQWLRSRFDCDLIRERNEKKIILRIGKEWGNKVKDYL